MDKKILASLLMIGILAAVLGGATYAVFSDTEKSVDNTMTAGTIDFSVDGENPWTSMEWSEGLGDLKPCVVRYGEFNITNVGTNPMKLWKKLTIKEQNGGDDSYYKYASSEPEYVEGGGEFDECGTPILPGNYTERCNLSNYTTYDMNVTIGGDPVVLISDNQQIRLDDVDGFWIELGELPAGQSMIVNQSYHLQSEVTNWAQGDVMTFDVELYGEQVTGPGLNGSDVFDPSTWT